MQISFKLNLKTNFILKCCRTLQRPFKNHLPPTGKAIPPPKISDTYQSKASLASPKPLPTISNGTHGSTSPPPPPLVAQPAMIIPPNQSSLSSSPPLPPPPIAQQIQNPLQANVPTSTLPAPPPNNPNDESNYAVTEL